jgi:hypothetical protein
LRQRDTSDTATSTARSRGGRVGGGGESVGREIGSMREAGGIAAHDPQARAAIATGHQFLDATVVETSTRRAPILYEHLGKVTAVA